MKRSIGIEEVIDVNDDRIWWFYIHSYNSYEISSPIPYEINVYTFNGNKVTFPEGGSIIRSFKSAYKYPWGILVIPKNRSNINDPAYELTNNNNERTCIRLSQLVHIAKNIPYAVSNYPRHTNMTSLTCRNERIFVTKKLKTPELDSTQRFYPKFNIIEDEEDLLEKNPNMTPVPNMIHLPLESIDGSEYYGRRDIKVEYGRTNY